MVAGISRYINRGHRRESSRVANATLLFSKKLLIQLVKLRIYTYLDSLLSKIEAIVV